jgi:hypothetical protein
VTKIPKKVSERLAKQLVVYQKELRTAKDRDLNESDTVSIIRDMLADIFGFGKFSEVTTELAIRGTYCDLAIIIDGKTKYLIEAKAIGLTLKENHLRQVLNYGANHGIPWIVLTNGVNWEIYRIKFERPIDYEHTCSIDMFELNPRRAADLQKLYLLCKEGLANDAISDYHEYAQVMNRFVIAALIQSEPVLQVMRKEIRRICPNAKATVEEIGRLLPDVLKRDAIEGDVAKRAQRRVNRVTGKSAAKQPSKPMSPECAAPSDIPEEVKESE